jgi:hypothetical protein
MSLPNRDLNKNNYIMEQRKCLACGEPLIGRSDKKFCNDSCRNNYHYEQNHQQINIVRNVNNILSRNYNVLKKLNPEGKARVSRRQLLEKGFDFKYFTNIYTTKKGSVYHVIYDEAYVAQEGESEYYILVENPNL